MFLLSSRNVLHLLPFNLFFSFQINSIHCAFASEFATHLKNTVSYYICIFLACFQLDLHTPLAINFNFFPSNLYNQSANDQLSATSKTVSRLFA